MWLFDILKSAANYLLGWVFRGAVIKFGILSAVFYVISWIAEEVFSQIDISALTNLSSTFGSLPEAILWLMDLFAFDLGIPLVLGAMIGKFIIRRIPLIG